jgi:hypothetical protein
MNRKQYLKFLDELWEKYAARDGQNIMTRDSFDKAVGEAIIHVTEATIRETRDGCRSMIR